MRGENRSGFESLMAGLRVLLREERGTTAIEYALIASLIVLAAASAMAAMSESVINIFNYWTDAVVNALRGG
ncbi:MAG TPA: Flp family type IVb pilin [Syntrophobacter fumaroxidans]|nr:Flp family type IVb pilin [Syntrophobacter fumaroxidans]